MEKDRLAAFLDLEASGLGAGCYPIEIAWVSSDLSLGYSALLRRTDDWFAWEWNAEAIHGISREMLNIAGESIVEVCTALNGDLYDADILTDNPHYDGMWTNQLFVEAGVKPRFPVKPPPSAPFPQDLGKDWLLNADRLIAQAQDARKEDLIFLGDCEMIASRVRINAGIQLHHALDDCLEHAIRWNVIDFADETGDALDAACLELAGRVKALRERVRNAERNRAIEQWGPGYVSRHGSIYDAVRWR